MDSVQGLIISLYRHELTNQILLNRIEIFFQWVQGQGYVGAK